MQYARTNLSPPVKKNSIVCFILYENMKKPPSAIRRRFSMHSFTRFRSTGLADFLSKTSKKSHAIFD